MRIIAAAGLLASLAACETTDPLLNQNNWNPTGANGSNIAAQVVNPADLVVGRAPTGGADGELASKAILRFRTGHVKPLPDSSITELHVQSTPSPAAGAP